VGGGWGVIEAGLLGRLAAVGGSSPQKPAEAAYRSGRESLSLAARLYWGAEGLAHVA